MLPHAEATKGGVWFRSPLLDLALGSDVPLRIEGAAAVADFDLAQGDEVSFVFGEADPRSSDVRGPFRAACHLLTGTVDYWHALAGEMHLPRTMA